MRTILASRFAIGLLGSSDAPFMDGALGSYHLTALSADPSIDVFVNWLAAIATILPVVMGLLASRPKAEPYGPGGWDGFFSIETRRGRARGMGDRVVGTVRLRDLAVGNDAAETVYRVLRATCVSSFAVGFLVFLCMIDAPRYELAEWMDLIATPGSLRYYALFVGAMRTRACAHGRGCRSVRA